MDESSAGVGEKPLSEELCEFDFVSEEGASDIEGFSSDYCYSLTCFSQQVPLRRAFAM